MKHIMLFLCLLVSADLSGQAPSEPGPDLERFRPTEEQAWKLAEYTREFGHIETHLSEMYGDLKLLGYVSENDESLMPLRTSHLKEFELRDSTLSEETVRIFWKGGAPSRIVFRIRTATVRGLRTIVTVFRMDSVRQGNDVHEPDIDFISIENLPSGRGNTVYYTLTAWNAPAITDKTRTYQDGSVTYTFPFSQVREPAQKIEIMGRLLDSYRYLDRHLDYLITRSVRKELNDMNRYMPKP